MKLLVAPLRRLGLSGPGPDLKVQKHSWPSLLIKWLIMVSVMNVVSGCGPGRGAGRRRGVPKLTPLVFKQHVPNVSENTLGASGVTEGRITRDDPRFRELMPNYNSDIIFKDEEGTGADRFMTQRCKEKLNTLAISVMNQWPGVKLRVTEGWDEQGHHASDSLHYEGRAVDVTTSDRDRGKYGMLAKLAVEAGFDWVYYESKAHIHCSVKSESSQAVKSGGCFPGDAKVKTRSGDKPLSSLQIGDVIQVLDTETGQIKYSEVLLFLDRNPGQFRDYLLIETESGRKLQVTPSHLIVAIKNIKNSELNDISVESTNDSESINNNNNSYERTENNFLNEVTSDTREKGFDSSSFRETFESQIIFASQVEIGDSLIIATEGDKKLIDKVVDVKNSRDQGVYAPLTAEGTVVINDVVASCYAVVNSHYLAHLVYGPLRLYHNLESSFQRMWGYVFKPLLVVKYSASDRSQEGKIGIHWYASFLYDLAEYVLPKSMLYTS